MNIDALELAKIAVKSYAESHPRPLQVTQKQAAEMLEISIPTVRKMIAHGSLKLNESGLIHISEVDRALMPKAA